MISRHPYYRAGLAAGFTLVEVVLAIVIALGILVVLLFFYQQATTLRSHALQETERIAAARLILDRMAGELRTIARGLSGQRTLSGRSNSIQFVMADVPSFSAWLGGALGRSAFPVTDLKSVWYRLESEDGTNVAGLLRTEEPFVQQSQILIDERIDEESTGTNSVAPLNALMVLPEIRFLQFRYWAGTNWLEAWDSTALPQGVEVSLGPEPVTNLAETAELPGDVFRRVIYLGGVTPRPGSFGNFDALQSVQEEAP